MTRSMTRIAELEKENAKLKMENERLQKQTGDLWELASFTGQTMLFTGYPILDVCKPITALIKMRGESYVKEVFAGQYQYFKKTTNDEEDELDE